MEDDAVAHSTVERAQGEPPLTVADSPQAREPLAIGLREDPAVRLLRSDPRLRLSERLTVRSRHFQPERARPVRRHLNPARLSFLEHHPPLEGHEAIGKDGYAHIGGREALQLEDSSG